LIALAADERILRPPRFVTHQLGPAAEQSIADDVRQHVTVARFEHIGRRRRLHAITRTDAVALRDALFDQVRCEDRHRSAEQRSLHLLPGAGLHAMDDRGQRAERRQDRGAEIDVRRGGLDRVSRRAGNHHRTRHGLADAVETAPIAIRAFVAERGLCREDDVGLEGAQRLVVEAERPQRGGWQVCDDDVGRPHEPAHDLAASFARGVERHGLLVAGGLEKDAAVAALEQGCDVAVLAAVALFDANDFGAEITEQRRADGPAT
jgi:hypothetical protein